MGVMFSREVLDVAARVLEQARGKTLRIATAESCTGGLIAGALTAIPGSSDVFDRGFVTYSNEAKIELLGVAPALLANYGTVSREVAMAMAEGALAHSDAQLAVSCTGIAGPGGGTAAKPVGLVYVGVAHGRKTHALECRFGELSRHEIRMRSVAVGLQLLIEATSESP
jgi:nicotinamide-nucleotide amidase